MVGDTSHEHSALCRGEGEKIRSGCSPRNIPSQESHSHFHQISFSFTHTHTLKLHSGEPFLNNTTIIIITLGDFT